MIIRCVSQLFGFVSTKLLRIVIGGVSGQPFLFNRRQFSHRIFLRIGLDVMIFSFPARRRFDLLRLIFHLSSA